MGRRWGLSLGSKASMLLLLLCLLKNLTFPCVMDKLTFRRVMKKKNIKGFSCVPYVLVLFNCCLYRWYALPVSPNLVGTPLCILLLILYFNYLVKELEPQKWTDWMEYKDDKLKQEFQLDEKKESVLVVTENISTKI
ncbi:hypothetical protein R3W88_016396 [Solanum pinnatisectum]|uniref:Uncharacterized protein n=1 Tax=Solanum pinnatisectum TaxID=50273 RepID=A0AAV9KXE7_9SOLN|nr:hypothetical protein R3W88_016396 [Solanum pinnatisectum]